MFTRFHDMCSGGRQKTEYSMIYIEGNEEEAIDVFMTRFSFDPTGTSCRCCGADYYIDEFDTFEEARRHDDRERSFIVIPHNYSGE